MKKYLKFFVMILAVALMAIPLSACGSSDNSQTSKYTLTLNKTGQGSITGNGSFEADMDITITATAARGYEFEGWFNGSILFSANNSHTFQMPKNNLTLTARFNETPATKYALTVMITDGGTISGSVPVSISGVDGSVSEQFANGENLTFTASAKSGYKFDGWYVGVNNNQDILKVSSSTTFSFNMPEQYTIFMAKFVLNSVTSPQVQTYMLSVAVTGSSYGTVSGTVNILLSNSSATIFLNQGSNISLTWGVANTSTTFIGWYRNGSLVSTSKTYTFSMPTSSVSIEARFR